MPSVSRYAINLIPVTSGGGGAEAADKSVLYWDAVNNQIKGDAVFLYNDSTDKLTLTGSIDVTSGAAGTIPLAVKAFSGQTANLQEWQNSSGTALSAIDKDGSFTGTIAAGQVLGPPKPHTHNYVDLVGTQFMLPDGTATLPSLSFGIQNSTGFWRSGTGEVRFSSVGQDKLAFSSNIKGISSMSIFWIPETTQISGGSAPDLSISRAAAGSLLVSTASTSAKLAVKAGSAQTLNLQEWQNSSGTVLSRIDKDGQTTDFILAGQIFGF